MENDDRITISNNDLKYKCFKLFPLLIKDFLKDKYGFKRWFNAISGLAIEFGCLNLILNDEKDLESNEDLVLSQNYNSFYRFMRYFIINTTNPCLHHHFIQFYSIRKMIEIIRDEICISANISLNLDNLKLNKQDVFQCVIDINDLDKFISAWEIFRAREQYLDEIRESQLKSNNLITENINELIYKQDELDSLVLLIELTKNQIPIDLKEISNYFLKYHNKLFFSEDTFSVYSISEPFYDHQQLFEEKNIDYSQNNDLGQNAKRFKSN